MKYISASTNNPAASAAWRVRPTKIMTDVSNTFPLVNRRSRDVGGIADLDPDAARTGLIGAIDLLRHDALGPKPASMGEDGRTILGDVFVESLGATTADLAEVRPSGHVCALTTVVRVLKVVNQLCVQF
jgi:hypothetical protein